MHKLWKTQVPSISWTISYHKNTNEVNNNNPIQGVDTQVEQGVVAEGALDDEEFSLQDINYTSVDYFHRRIHHLQIVHALNKASTIEQLILSNLYPTIHQNTIKKRRIK